MIPYVSMILCSFAGGFLQSVTGFGGGIVVMLVLPMFLSVLQSSAVAQVITVPMQIALICKYRKHIRLETVIRPTIFYMVVCLAVLRVATGFDAGGLKRLLGAFLFVLALYLLFVAQQLRLQPTWKTSAICGSLSGVSAALFSLNGPPMVPYFMAVTGGEKFVYIGTIQAFFFLTGLYTTAVRVMSGIFTASLIPFVLCGMVGMLIGQAAGSRLVERIDQRLMSRLVYGFLAVAGLLNMIG